MTPWQKLLAQLKKHYGAEENGALDDGAREIIRSAFQDWYEHGRLNGVVEEAARQRKK